LSYPTHKARSSSCEQVPFLAVEFLKRDLWSGRLAQIWKERWVLAFGWCCVYVYVLHLGSQEISSFAGESIG
jgi:hypothetical protein